MVKEEEEGRTRRHAWTRSTIGGQIVCPVCSETVRGDQGVLEAHVDVCVANENLRLEAARQAELALQQVDEWEEMSDGEDNIQYAGNALGE